MPKWLIYSLLAVLAWGAWGIVSKLAADALAPDVNQVLCTFGLLIPALLALQSNRRTDVSRALRGGALGFSAGLAGALGNLAFFAALSAGGKAAVVVPLAAVYPLVTVVLACWILRENLRWIQAVGIAGALAAVFVLSAEEGTVPQFTSLLAGLKVNSWTGFALLALLLYGLSALLQKMATNLISANLAFFAFAAAFVPLALALLAWKKIEWPGAVSSWVWAVGGGALNGLGVLATLAAYRHGGQASVVTPLAALYPGITLLLAFLILGERISFQGMAGIVLALGSAVLLSSEPERTERVKPETPESMGEVK